MGKNKFIADYQVNTSKKVLFPYLSTASGLASWFADEVKLNPDKTFIFTYDKEEHHARIVAMRQLAHVKFEFFHPEGGEVSDSANIEFKLEENELTQTLFLKIVDQNEHYSDEELRSIWEGLVGNLKEILGA
ncbi:hypothetical protein A3SI_17799 [Nitritalea halalkaliphila LW7]|uniref:START-like domain-containing protein n=1 Tax=Nitritalea halalkaliphila LW7 TaxID=1189621 RepID=I5BV29_9BACT|nr:START-like domain-containing protein [Nitritalea halalkaliphila]EIM73431.1 hypothetical protein A3SI_17799 [Nitritalea halalkaliphila LW7]